MPENKADENLINAQLQLFNSSEDKTDDELIDAEIKLINISARQAARSSIEVHSDFIKQYARQEYTISPENVRILVTLISSFFKRHLLSAGYESRKIKALITKFRDAGRRSAPWKSTSSLVPGRPQDGSDGNRINRWLLPFEHKFYAAEVDATLVEVKYYLQTLSMAEAPPLASNSIQQSFIWLLGHSVEPGTYLDPIQLIPIKFDEFITKPTAIQSGHLIPLDRGGRHTPDNTFLMLERSNQIQGNQTLEELLELMERVVRGYQERRQTNK